MAGRVKLSENHLIIFSRFPEAGKTKTRLIPTLGEKGAADLQRQMTEHTLRWARQMSPAIALQVYFTGASLDQMQNWLGKDLLYAKQADGDLGNRMLEAFDASFALGAKKVLTIGIDCPQLSTVHIQQAFDLLDNADVVLGPALDGGYYLIGMRESRGELFGNIDWGSDLVFSQSKKIVEQNNWSFAALDMLADVDLPKDLEIWQRQQQSQS
jgi:rSAM/selenodomain-associated transferase 1